MDALQASQDRRSCLFSHAGADPRSIFASKPDPKANVFGIPRNSKLEIVAKQWGKENGTKVRRLKNAEEAETPIGPTEEIHPSQREEILQLTVDFHDALHSHLKTVDI